MQINPVNLTGRDYNNVSFSKGQNRTYTPSTVSNFELDKALDALSAQGKALLTRKTEDGDCHINLTHAESAMEGKCFKIYHEAKDLQNAGQNTLAFIDSSLKDLGYGYTDIIEGPFIYEDKSMTVHAVALAENPATIQFYEKEAGQHNPPLYFANSGQITSVALNADNSRGSLKADKVFFFKDGKLTEYVEDYYKDAKGNERKGREFIFSDEGLPPEETIYNEGVDTRNGRTTIQKSAHFEKGVLTDCDSKIKISYNKPTKVNLALAIEDREIVEAEMHKKF